MSSISMQYVHTTRMGYGRVGVMLAKEFEKQNIEVFDGLEGQPERGAFDDPELEKLAAEAAVGKADDAHLLRLGEVISPLNGGRNWGRSNTLLWVSVPSHATGWWKGQQSVMLTMWEAMTLPQSFHEGIHNFDKVIVPSQQNLELFSKYHPDVTMIPLGFDPDVWQFRKRQTPDRFFRFLIGGSGSRKGTDLAAAAFNKLWGRDGSWGSGPEPRLLMKNPKGEDWFRGDGRIEMISGRLSGEEEADLYGSAHCYLQPSRGEGFGLQPLQAIAQGCPTILTGAHGHKSYSHLGWEIGSTPSKSAYFIFGDAGDWWEPSLDDLCDHMKWIYSNYEKATWRAYMGSVAAHKQFTWKHCADKILDTVGRDNLGPYTGPDEWFQPELKLFPLVTRENFPADIGGKSYFFEAGKEYWSLADVKRVLFEAGKLDPCCLQEDDVQNLGLAPEQVKKLGWYRDACGTCPTCGSDLHDAIPRTAAEIEARG